MTERLTKRLPDEFDGKWINVKENDGGSADIHYNDYEIGMFYDAIAKLAHYEDLEEQGRLHIVPKGFWKAIVTYLVNDRCPYDFGLKGFNEEDCKVDIGRCKECWEKALKGE